MLRNLLLGTALAAFGVVGSANALVIDNFDVPLNAGQSISGVFASSATPVGDVDYDDGANGNVLGGIRNLQSFVVDQPGGQFLIAQISVASGAGGSDGAFTHNQGSLLGAYSVITWDRGGLGLTDGDGTNGDGFDLTEGGGNTGFRLGITAADQGSSWAIRLCEATSSGGDCDIYEFPTSDINNQASPPVPIIYQPVSFLEFAGLNLQDIASIQFFANYDADAGTFASRSFNTTVTSFEAVPEPATMTLLGAGLAGVGLLARRRRKSA